MRYIWMACRAMRTTAIAVIATFAAANAVLAAEEPDPIDTTLTVCLNYGDGLTESGMRACWGKAAEAWQTRMTVAYSKLLIKLDRLDQVDRDNKNPVYTRHPSDRKMRYLLVQSQEAWKAFNSRENDLFWRDFEIEGGSEQHRNAIERTATRLECRAKQLEAELEELG